MAINKRLLANIAAGTVAVAAIVFGVKQCSDKNGARDEAKNWHALFNEKNEALINASNAKDAANKHIDELKGEVGDLADSLIFKNGVIAQKDSTILQLTDSLAVVNGKLVECENSKKAKKDCGCRGKKKTSVKKPVAEAPAKEPCTVVKTPECDQKPVVFVEKDEKKVVVKDTPKTPDQSVIVNGVNSGTIIVNANGIVSDNTIVNGNNNTVNSAKQNELLEEYKCGKKPIRVVGERLVRCH